MNRPTLAAALLELLQASPLRPSVEELAAELGVPAEDVVRALGELFDLAQIGSPPQGGKNSE